MKRLLYAVLFLSVLMVTWTPIGCAVKQGIHAGATNQVDSDIYDGLLTCQAALEQAKAEFGTNPSAKPTLNQAINTYNSALDGYLAYKAGTASDLVDVQRKLANIIQDIGSLKQQFGQGVQHQ